MKKLLLVAATCLSSSVFAATSDSDTVVKLDGFFQFQAGFANQNKLTSAEKKISNNRKDFGFYTEATLAATVAKTVDDITYGGKLILVPTTKPKTSAAYNGSHIFVESSFGKVEAGSPYDAGSKMRVIGDLVSAGTGGSTGNWARYANLKSDNMKYFGTDTNKITKGVAPEFVDYKEYFFDSLFRTQLDQVHDKAEPARKISYFTPKTQGFQFGISYIPDSGNVGGGTHNDDSLKSKSGVTDVKVDGDNTYVLNRNVKDAFSAGVTYEYNISEGVDLKLGATGEYGKAAGKIKLVSNKGKDNEDVLGEYKPADLRTYNLGAILTYGSFSYAASYGTLGKSLTSKEYHKTGRNTWYYNGAIAYSQGPIKTSVSYFKSDRFKSTVDAVALGTEYKFLPGLVPYAEIACFQAKGRPAHYLEAPKKKTKGTVALIGAKLKL